MTRNQYPERPALGTRTLSVLNTPLAPIPLTANENDTMRSIGVVINMVLDSIKAGRAIE